MRFTKAQAALFRNKISFIHMSSTKDKMELAKSEFLTELNRMGTYYVLGVDRVYTDHAVSMGAFAHFGFCTPTPASVNHAPVLFMDGPKSEWSIPKLYDDCKYLPAAENGMGPMVVR